MLWASARECHFSSRADRLRRASGPGVRPLDTVWPMSRIPTEWRIPLAFAVLSLGSLIYSAAHAWFWQRAHDMAWLATPLLLLLLALLLWRRSRAAWWILVAFSVIGLASDLAYISTRPRLGMGVHWVIAAAIGLVEFGLLLSPQMRDFVQWRRRRLA